MATTLTASGVNRTAEWALWAAGLGGSLAWIGFQAFIAMFSHGDYPPDGMPSPVEFTVAAARFTLPSAVHVGAVVAAMGIGRGASWAVPLGRVIGVLLVAGLPLGLLPVGPDSILEARHLFGLPLGGEGFYIVAIGAQAALGALTIWALRSSSPPTFAPIRDERRPGGLTRAGAILIGLGIWQAALLTVGLVATFADGLEGDAMVDITSLSIAAIAFAVVAIAAGRGVLGERRWAPPAVVPAVVTLVAWDGLLTMQATSSVIASEQGNLIALAAGVLVVGIGLYVLVAVFRSRSRFVRLPTPETAA
jgi:hypothetical protein